MLSRNSFFNNPFDFETSREDTVMRSDVTIENDIYQIQIELPGIQKENIGLDYENGYLKVTAVKENKEEENVSYVRRERFYGEYSRTFYIGNVKEEEIRAHYENGILTIHFPKESKIENRKIQID